jgi:hypothetical protein
MAANPDSILDTVKDALGYAPEYTVFDMAITMHINAAIGSLLQFGVGGDTGFVIQDNSTLWSQYVSSMAYLNMVKQYIFMSVRLAFDPPASGFAITAIKEQIQELGWRIRAAVEQETPPPDPFAVEEILDLAAAEDQVVFEGGVMPSYFAPKVKTLDWAEVVTPDARDGNVFWLTLTADCTVNAPVNGVDGQHLTMGITGAGFHLTWGNGWNFGDAGLPVLTPGKTDFVSGVYRATRTEWDAGFTQGF